ncbi:tyrosine-type recombinase/integrase [Polynucleobacter sp. AP-RePozz3-80-G7]|uniref:tyrosine-type recombinase/integrase n=1 Tax=Polynucleobacter sp. AP-RePozz3-80-G7 TaxID=2689105 RepID=UPI001C0E56B1|nr:tyrosine-type recombinase/integrase [Polynucleobacter sp. AP-RePozz3-80-G7]MBU3639130.1 tyrosine-type recombinase/integrase [Polynucleobacter sp. AP-RePozz3-80-G7]
MANRTSNQLSAKFVETTKTLGNHLDGDGLYLQVREGARGISKSWIFRYQLNKRVREMGFGALKDVSLQAARLKLAESRKMLLEGKDPLYERNLKKSLNVPTFWECCEAYIEIHKSDWKNAKSELQWRNTLKNDAKSLSNIKVDFISTPLVLKVLQPIWNEKNDTARKLRGRIERVLDYAKSMGFRAGENPAAMKGNLEFSLAKKPTERIHQPSLHWKQLSTFIKELRKSNAVSRLALEFLILTASRTGEVINAQWDEIDLDEKRWTIPATRMKMAKEHAIPLSPSAIAILEKVKGLHEKWVFPNDKKMGALSNMAMLEVVRGIKGYKDKVTNKEIVVHGFRSTFRTWVSEATNFPAEIAEAALAHNNPNKVEASYLRSNQYQNRINLMNHFAQLAEGQLDSSQVLPFRSAA